MKEEKPKIWHRKIPRYDEWGYDQCNYLPRMAATRFSAAVGAIGEEYHCR